MNRRQRKKKDAKGLTLIFSCKMVCKQETYANYKLGLMPPLDQENTPQYIAGDMHINMYYDIYI